MNALSPRSRSVTITLWIVFLLGTWNAGRVLTLMRNGRTLAKYITRPELYVRLGLTLLWALLFWGLAVALWQKRPFARRAVPLLLSLYAIYELSLPVFFAPTPAARQGWLVNALFYLVIILFSVWSLTASKLPDHKNGEKEIHESQD